MTVPPLTERIVWAKHWIDSLYQTDGVYGYIKEFPGFPLGIYVRGSNEYRFSGDWGQIDPDSTPVSKLTSSGTSRLADITDVGMEDRGTGIADWNEPAVTVQRYYSDDDGTTTYRVSFMKWDGSADVDFYVGDVLIWRDIKDNRPRMSSTTCGSVLGRLTPATRSAGYTASAIGGRYMIAGMKSKSSGGFTIPNQTDVCLSSASWQGLPGNRYTVRHASRLGYFMYRIWGDAVKATALQKLRADFGFTYDIYDPLFGISSEYSDGFVFSDQAYADTYNVWTRLPRGINPHRFPYLSKVSRSDVTRTAYIMQSHGDVLLRQLQAIHILNRYGDPYHQYYTNAGPPNPFDYLVTPVSIAQECIPNPWTEDPQAKKKWSYNQGGILHPSNETVVSGVRTAVWSILATLLAYRYNVPDFYWVADHVYNSLTGNFNFGDGSRAPQCGLFPFSPGWIETQDDGQLLRPPYHGAFYNLWRRGPITYNGNPCYGQGGTNGVQPCTHVNVVAVDKASSLLGDLADMYNMPSEDAGPIVSNPETTILMIQALRIYAYYALNTLIPRLGLPELIP